MEEVVIVSDGFCGAPSWDSRLVINARMEDPYTLTMTVRSVHSEHGLVCDHCLFGVLVYNSLINVHCL